MDAQKLDPLIRWKTLVGLLFNYIISVHEVLSEKLDTKMVEEIQKRLAIDFWAEQAQAFIDLFALKQGSLIDAHALKRTFATLFDIKYKTITEAENMVKDEMEYKSCPFRVALEPIWPEICRACEFIGQLFISKVEPNIKHQVIIKGEVCYHITSKKKPNEN